MTRDQGPTQRGPILDPGDLVLKLPLGHSLAILESACAPKRVGVALAEQKQTHRTLPEYEPAAQRKERISRERGHLGVTAVYRADTNKSSSLDPAEEDQVVCELF